jgi:hypothetical protein
MAKLSQAAHRFSAVKNLKTVVLKSPFFMGDLGGFQEVI